MSVIHVYGTSHVSQESIELIDEKLEDHDPDIVALELDMLRLESLLTGQHQNPGTPFLWIAKKFQRYIGGKTGLMPGEEMKYAFQRAMNEEREVALVDQDIRITVDRLNKVSRKEKVRAGFSLLAGAFMPGSFDISTIPDKKQVDSLLEEFRREFPGLYQVLIEERNQVIAESLRQLQEDEPDATIVAFLGAGHVEDIREMLETSG